MDLAVDVLEKYANNKQKLTLIKKREYIEWKKEIASAYASDEAVIAKLQMEDVTIEDISDAINKLDLRDFDADDLNLEDFSTMNLGIGEGEINEMEAEPEDNDAGLIGDDTVRIGETELTSYQIPKSKLQTQKRATTRSQALENVATTKAIVKCIPDVETLEYEVKSGDNKQIAKQTMISETLKDVDLTTIPTKKINLTFDPEKPFNLNNFIEYSESRK